MKNASKLSIVRSHDIVELSKCVFPPNDVSATIKINSPQLFCCDAINLRNSLRSSAVHYIVDNEQLAWLDITKHVFLFKKKNKKHL